MKPRTDTWRIGEKCHAVWPPSGTWHQAVILKPGSEIVKVRYVEDGFTRQLKMHQVKAIDPICQKRKRMAISNEKVLKWLECEDDVEKMREDEPVCGEGDAEKMREDEPVGGEGDAEKMREDEPVGGEGDAEMMREDEPVGGEGDAEKMREDEPVGGEGDAEKIREDEPVGGEGDAEKIREDEPVGAEGDSEKMREDEPVCVEGDAEVMREDELVGGEGDAEKMREVEPVGGEGDAEKIREDEPVGGEKTMREEFGREMKEMAAHTEDRLGVGTSCMAMFHFRACSGVQDSDNESSVSEYLPDRSDFESLSEEELATLVDDREVDQECISLEGAGTENRVVGDEIERTSHAVDAVDRVCEEKIEGAVGISATNDVQFNFLVRGKKQPQCKQIYDKVNYCTFCFKAIQSKISRHLLTVHKDHPRVSAIQLLAKRSKERMQKLNMLANEGNFKHNSEVLKRGGTDIVIARRSSSDDHRKPASDYVPCEYCLKFVTKSHLWQHLGNCPEFHLIKGDQESSMLSGNALRRSKNLLHSFCLDSNEFSSSLLSRMQEGPIKTAVMNDPLILRFGALRVESLGDETVQKNSDVYRVSQSVRTLGRLLIEMWKTKKVTMSDALTPQNFDLVVAATKALANNPEKPAMNLARNIGNLIGHLIVTRLGFLLRKESKDEHCIDATHNFQRIFEAEWKHRVNAPAAKKLRLVNQEKIVLIPVTDDLIVLNRHLMQGIKESIAALRKTAQMNTWQKLSRYTMSRLIVFNKRRRAEVSELKLSAFTERREWRDDPNEEMMLSLSVLEKAVAARMDLMLTPGKSTKNNDAYVIIPPDCKEALDLLTMTRNQVGISLRNPFLFARPNANTPLAGHTELREIVEDCSDLKYPDRIKSTSLRKYIATVTQILDLKESELEILAKHLGHDPKTHKDFYRLQHSTLELSKVSKLLLALENGQINVWKGKNLDDIQLDDLPDLHAEEEEDIDPGPKEEDKVARPEEEDGVTPEEEDPAARPEEEGGVAGPEEEDGVLNELDGGRRPVKGTRKKWTELENQVLVKSFDKYLKFGGRISNSDMICIQNRLNNRTLPQIRTKLNNMRLGKTPL